MKDLTKAAAGALMLVACGNEPPKYSEPLTDSQRDEIKSDLKNLENITPVVQRILEHADPLYDLEGNPTEDNRPLSDGLELLQSDLRWYLENGHVVTAGLDVMVEKNNPIAFVRGTGTKRIEDNYLVVPGWELGLTGIEPSAYVHEASHFYYKEDRFHNSVYDAIDDGKIESLETYALEGDVAYMYIKLYAVERMNLSDEDTLYYIRQATEETETFFKGEDVSDEAKREYVEREYADMESYVGIDEADFMKESMVKYSEKISEYAELYSFIGVSEDEFSDVVRNSRELYNFDERNEVLEIMSEYETLYSEYRLGKGEVSVEIDAENHEQNQESQPTRHEGGNTQESDVGRSRWRGLQR